MKDSSNKKCEADNLIYTSHPPQKRCKNCGRFWFAHEETPICSATPKNSEWEERARKEIRDEMPNVFVQDAEDEIIRLIQSILQERSKDTVGELIKWAEGRKKNGYNVVRGSCAFCGIDPEDCDCDGYNNALDDLVFHLQKLSEQLNQK